MREWGITETKGMYRIIFAKGGLIPAVLKGSYTRQKDAQIAIDKYMYSKRPFRKKNPCIYGTYAHKRIEEIYAANITRT